MALRTIPRWHIAARSVSSNSHGSFRMRWSEKRFRDDTGVYAMKS
jgi:hypothetical protein